MWVRKPLNVGGSYHSPFHVPKQVSARQAKLGRARSHVEAHWAIRKSKWTSEGIMEWSRDRSKFAPRISFSRRLWPTTNFSSMTSWSANAMAEFSGGKEESVKILDMGAYFSGDDDRVVEFCEQLRKQCHEVGFFNVKNHGVPEVVCDSMLEMGRKFFDLPTEVKMQMDYTNSPQFRGYMRIGVENTAGVTDFREQIDLGPEEAEDIDVVDGKESKEVYPLYRRLRGPNQWPPEHLLPGFRRETELFVDKMNELSMHIMQVLALSLGLPKGFFDSTFQYMPHYQMKVARYPPQPDSEGVKDVGMFGVGAHSDSGFLSLLLQDDVGGLQVQTTGGRWIDVPPERGTFVVNLGEMLQLATSGYYLATVHRVVSQTGSKSRYSVPFFFNPRLDTDVRAFNILESEVGGELLHPLPQSTISKGGLSTHGGKNKLLPVFGQNAFKSFARSHVNVVRQHHKDLVQTDGRIELDKVDLELVSK